MTQLHSRAETRRAEEIFYTTDSLRITRGAWIYADSVYRESVASHAERHICVTRYTLTPKDGVTVRGFGPGNPADSATIVAIYRDDKMLCAIEVPMLHTHIIPVKLRDQPSATDTNYAIEHLAPFHLIMSDRFVFRLYWKPIDTTGSTRH